MEEHVQTSWRKLSKLMNVTTQGGAEEKTHRHYSRKWIYLGIKNKDDGNALNIWQALHMIAWKFVIQKHTKAAIEDAEHRQRR